MAETRNDTATAVAQADRQIDYAIMRLLYRLRRFMRAYPRLMGDEMPDHDVVWVDDIRHGGPANAILNAMKSHPELWLRALPEDVCIVPRKALATHGLSKDVVEYFSAMAFNKILASAHRQIEEERSDDTASQLVQTEA